MSFISSFKLCSLTAYKTVSCYHHRIPFPSHAYKQTKLFSILKKKKTDILIDKAIVAATGSGSGNRDTLTTTATITDNGGNRDSLTIAATITRSGVGEDDGDRDSENDHEDATSDSIPRSSSSGVNRYKTNVFHQKTGAFKRCLPDIFPAETHFKRALRTLKDVRKDTSIKNLRNQQRKLAAQTFDKLMKSLTVPITVILNAYKKTLRELHPYEATVAELTIIARVKKGLVDIEDVFIDLKQLRAATSKLAKEYASMANNATSSTEAKAVLDEGLQALQEMYESSSLASSLADLVEIQKDLRRIPIVELQTPTVVLVGAPNVGKSSIVRAVSSGTPEVNDYPFTTRGVTIGHIVDTERSLRFQVMDTPGLLDRPADERNEMENLTFASLLHLPTAVIFVIDATGLSGEKSTLTAQLNVRTGLKQRFPRRPWIDVVSKGDIALTEDVLAVLPAGHLSVSVKDGKNVDVLKATIESMLLSLQETLLHDMQVST